MFKLINVNKISNHPNNPRKDLGDLSELAESIKANGILQNLTVVSCSSQIKGKTQHTGYIAVIGHRRLAAAKLAGLTEVPCSIAEMDEKTQVATMLLENMQRSDLTILEQAEGFQMMLDLGDTVDNISEKTGFSESTVRRRVKLLDLDKDKFKESVERGATLQDYAELDKIKNIDLKNKVLEKIGTSNFKWEIQNAINQEKTEENKNKLIAELEAFATRVESKDGLKSVSWHYYRDKVEFQKPEDAGIEKYYFFVSSYDIQLLKETTKTDAESEAERAEAEKQQKIKERKERLDEISERAYDLRYEFIKNYTGVKKHNRDIMEFAIRSMIQDGWSRFDDDSFTKMLGLELGEDEDLTFEAISNEVAKSQEKVLLTAAYCMIGDEKNTNYYDYYGEHSSNEDLDLIYDLLDRVGYEISDDERAMRDGTHELFVI